VRTPDGAVWTQTMFGHGFWCRYLDVFTGVRVLARVRDVPTAPQGWQRADGGDVEFTAVPCYVGPWQYAIKRGQVQQTIRSAIGADAAMILRVPSQLAVLAYHAGQGRLFGVEAVGDPYDGFAPSAIRHPLRPLFRILAPRQMRQLCREAVACAYVTQQTLQSRYPAAPQAFVTNYSSVELPAEAFAGRPRVCSWTDRRARLVTVGSMANRHKGCDLLIDALSQCIRAGLDVGLTFVGDGRHRAELQDRAHALGLGDRVRFCGQLTAGVAVRRELDAADMFVLPSRAEGMPRSMIEAMARGLPCIGSAIGGIPELLPTEDLVPPGDAEALAAKIQEVLRSPERLTAMAQRNLARAREFCDERLRARRVEFYRRVRDETERRRGRSHRGGQHARAMH